MDRSGVNHVLHTNVSSGRIRVIISLYSIESLTRPYSKYWRTDMCMRQTSMHMHVDINRRKYRYVANICTTIAALYAKICPQNRTDFYPHGLNSTPITEMMMFEQL